MTRLINRHVTKSPARDPGCARAVRKAGDP